MPKTDVLELFESKPSLNVCAPMVRYSKLEFRSLVRKYGCDLCFTPMIMADSFVQSEKARQNEFTTNEVDTPLIVQFAAKCKSDFVEAAKLVSPFADGVDLNCGCPQRWAMKDGYGAELMSCVELVEDMVRQVRESVPRPFTVSVKMRLKDSIRDSVDMCQKLEKAGVSFLTVHGRTVQQRNDPVNFEAIKNIVQSVQVPVIANGGIKSLEDVFQMRDRVSCKGVMAAQGILTNPALFAGHQSTPVSCVQDWIDLALASGVTFQCFHHHLVFMLEKVLSKDQRVLFNSLTTVEDDLAFLENALDVRPILNDEFQFSKSIIRYDDVNGGDGKFFKEKCNETDSEDLLGDSWFNS